MNKIYKVVWNTVRNCYVVGSELISSKSGRHSTSNGKSSSLKVTLTVLALCGMTALGSGLAPAYAADTGATTAMNQYVALKYDSSNNQNEKPERINGTRQMVTEFNGQKYIKVNSGVTDTAGRRVYYWVREGYSLTMVDGQPYTSLSSNGRRADVSWTGDANAKPSDILESVTSTHVQTNVTTNVGETLQQVNAGTYAGVTNSGGTQVDGNWDYIVKDSSWKGVVSDSNYRNGYADLISNGKPKGFVRATDKGSKLAWNATLNAYTYNGKVVDYSNIYVIDGEIGVFTNASGSEVYTGTVFGKNNEVLMTVKKSDGKYYSYWGAEVNDAGATMDTYRVAEYQKDLNVLRDNDFALYHNDIKSVDMSTDTSSATISLMRNGDGTSNPAVDGTLTITNGGGTGGNDTYVRISNTTNGQEVYKDFSTGSKVEAVGSKEATTGLKINGETYNIKTGQTYTAGANVNISGENVISATNTTLSAGEAEKKGDSYIVKDTAGNEVTLEDVASASQLTKVNNQVTKNTQDITNNTTNITELGEKLEGAVMYDRTATSFDKNNVTLGGTTYDSEKKTGGTKITNLARGTKDSDAVNFSQLKEVEDAENYVTDGSLSTTDGTITLNRLKDGPVTITGLQNYVKGLDSYVTGATLNGNTLTLARNQGLDSLTVDLGSLTDGLSSTDYRLIASATNGGKYVVKNGEVNLTVQDAQNPNHMETITISGLASATDVNESKVHYFSVYEQKNMAKLPKNYNNDGATGDRAIAIGVNASASGKFSVAIGSGQNSDGATTSGNYATAVGNGSLVSGESSMALGYNAKAINAYSVAVGNESLVNGSNSMALGAYSAAGNQDSIVDSATAVGSLAHVYAEDGTALGENAEVLSKGKKGTALGTAAKVKAREGTAIGAYSSVSAEGGVAVGKGSVADRAAGMKGYAPVGEAGTSPVWKATDGAVSLGSDSSARTRQITNLAAGTENTDAVNVAQLKRARVELTNGTNTTVKSTNDQTDGHVIYSVDVSNEAIQKATDITGNNGIDVTSEDVNGVKTYKVSAKLSDNLLVNNTGNIDLASVLHVGSKITVDGNKGEITGLTNKTLDAADFAKVGRAATEEQLKEVDSKATAAKTTVTAGKNIAVNGTSDENGSAYTVALAEDVSLGNNAIQLKGTDGSISAKSGGAQLAFNNSGLTVSQAKNGLTNETRIDGAKITVNGGAGNQTIINGSTAHIGSVLVNGGSGTATITGLTNKTTDYTGFANGSGRAATEEQLKEVASKATAAMPTVKAGKNISVNGESGKNGSTTYTVALADDVSLGKNNAIQLKGTDGSISATSGGAQLAFNSSGLTVSQAKNGLTNETRINGAEITVDGGIGNQTTIKGSTARIGSVLVNGGSGTATISGLTNQTTKYNGFANGSGRAATEEQLKEVAGQAGEAIDMAGKGWNLTTNGKEASKTNIKPGGTVDFSSRNDNLVISNADANLSFSLSDNLDLTKNDSKKGSVKVGKNTALTDELLQVGNSSLTTSALMVGGWTYISSSGLNANNRVISNVADGKADTDAVNVGQLKSAIIGSQVSIKAGKGISVDKTGNKYTINVNINGVSNDQGEIAISEKKDSTSTESGSESGSSGAKKFKVMDLMYRADANEVTEETTTETTTDPGTPLDIENKPKDIKFEADDNQAAEVVNGETIKIAGDGVNISTSSKLTGESTSELDTISVSLKPDIKVDSIEAKTEGGQINIKSEVNMNSQKITNLADGEIAEGSTDAVNGGQLYNTNQAVIANAENINSLSHSLNKLDSRINRVGAGAAALAALHPLDFDPDNKWDFAAGYGNYAGANAVAIGTYYRPNENTMFSIGGSFGGGENMINAGVSFKLGSGGSGITTSKTVMAKKIKEQDELLKAQDAKMKEQDEKIAKLEALVAQQGEMIQQALGKK